MNRKPRTITIFPGGSGPDRHIWLGSRGPYGGSRYLDLGPLTRERVDELKDKLETLAQENGL